MGVISARKLYAEPAIRSTPLQEASDDWNSLCNLICYADDFLAGKQAPLTIRFCSTVRYRFRKTTSNLDAFISNRDFFVMSWEISVYAGSFYLTRTSFISTRSAITATRKILGEVAIEYSQERPRERTSTATLVPRLSCCS